MSQPINAPAPYFVIARQPDARAAWLAFERALADALADLGEDEYLVIDTKQHHYFVQFAGEGAFGMRAEAVSNAYLDGDRELAPGDCAALVGLGWHPPTHAPGDDAPATGSTNFYVDAAAPVPYATLAALAVTTLRHVFRVSHPGHFQYRAFTRTGAAIRFPALRLKRREPVRARPSS